MQYNKEWEPISMVLNIPCACVSVELVVELDLLR